MAAKIIKNISEMASVVDRLKFRKSIGFVPTMGFLHKGHLSLVEEAKKNCEIVIVSIYVNPTQFGEGEDFDSYPQDFDKDLAMLNELAVDYVFFPNSEQMYAKPYLTWVLVDGLTSVLCGKSRPEHFKGVTTIVCKLMNIVQPDFMYMGDKDFQQIAVLKQMIKDLNIRTKIVNCPIYREKDGLAMSSRNSYLTQEERKQAIALYNSLLKAKELFGSGLTDSKQIKHEVSKILSASSGLIDYIEILNEKTLEDVEIVDHDCRIFLAVKIGKPRLIDNMSFSS